MLNGGTTPYLIVPNSGSNNVLIYPVLPNGFGAGLNGGQGFFTGTDPTGITVADVNNDGRLDLVVADKGSNDVDILINQPRGRRLHVHARASAGEDAGYGPTATVVRDVNGDGIPDILVSDSGSNNVLLIKGVGGGFFDDLNPTQFETGVNPGPIFVGDFTNVPGQLDLVTLDAGSNDLTVVYGINGGQVVTRRISSGGITPIAGTIEDLVGGITGLLVANDGDGRLVLFLGGLDGLQARRVSSSPIPRGTPLVADHRQRRERLRWVRRTRVVRPRDPRSGGRGKPLGGGERQLDFRRRPAGCHLAAARRRLAGDGRHVAERLARVGPGRGRRTPEPARDHELPACSRRASSTSLTIPKKSPKLPHARTMMRGREIGDS